MEKLKTILNPGHKKDDEVLYGDGQVSSSPQKPQKSGHMTGEGSHFGGQDEESLPVSSSTAGTSGASSGAAAGRHPIYDEFAGKPQTGSAGTTPASNRPDHGIAGTDHAPGTMGTGAHTPIVGKSAHVAGGSEGASVASIKSGVIGQDPHAENTGASNPPLAHAGNTTEQTPATAAGTTGREFPLAGGTTTSSRQPAIPETSATSKTNPPVDFGHHDHKTPVLGGAAAAGGAAALAGHHSGRSENEPSTVGIPSGQSGRHQSDVHQPMDRRTEGTTDHTSGIAGPTSTNRAQDATATPSHNTGRAGLADAAAAVHQHGHGGKGHEFSGDPCGSSTTDDPTSSPSQGYMSGPHSTQTANRIDPHVRHVPGAFPISRNASEMGDLTGTSQSGMTTQPHASNLPSTSTSTAKESQDSHHYGRDAALAGAGAAAGGGAYAAHKGGEAHRAGPTDTDPASKTVGSHKSDVANVLDPRVQPDPSKQKSGRSGSTDQDPAPHTVGPHKSDVVNVLDPRVQPDPAKQKSPTQPHKSKLLNKLDPRIKSTKEPEMRDQAPTQTEEHQSRGNEASHAALGAGGAAAAGLAANKAWKQHSDEPHTGYSSPYSSAKVDPRVDGGSPTSSRTGPIAATTGPGSSKAAAPESVQRTPKTEKGDHYGRDAALTGGTGAAGIGAYEASKHHREPQQTSSAAAPTAQTTAPVSGTAAAPSQQTTQLPPISGTQKGWHAGPAGTAIQGQQQAQMQPRHDHHDGRDAALAGGAGATGLGAYEASKHHHREPQESGPLSSTGNQGVPPASGTATGPTAGTTAPTQSLAHRQQQTYPVPEQRDHHYGRDAAMAGGAGAAGLGAYEATKKHDEHQPLPAGATSQHAPMTASHQAPITTPKPIHPQPSQPTATALEQQRAVTHESHADPTGTKHTERHGTARSAPIPVAGQTSHPRETAKETDADREREHHYGRDAALAGGAGAAAYAGKKEYDSKAAKKADEERIKQLEKDQHKQHVQEEKEHKKYDKEMEKEHKKHEKEIEKEHKKHEKEIEKEHKKADKERRKSESHHGILGFLHRDKDKRKEEDPEARGLREGTPEGISQGHDHSHAVHPRQARRGEQLDEEHPDHLSSSATSTRAGTGFATSHPRHSAEHHEQQGHEDELGRKTSLLGSQHGRNKLHKEPPKDYFEKKNRSRATSNASSGGAAGVGRSTSTSTHEHPTGQAVPHGAEHSGVAGHPGQYGQPGQYATANEGMVTEPRTGLPMNVGKYGSGEGGVDSSNTVHGYRQPGQTASSVQTGAIGEEGRKTRLESDVSRQERGY